MAWFKYFLLLYFIGNSNYLTINCVPKLVWGCSQAIRFRHINKVFFSILFYSTVRRQVSHHLKCEQLVVTYES